METRTIIERAKQALGLSSDIQLADALGISKSTLSNWKTRNTIDYDVLFSKCEQVDLNWLIKGNDERPVAHQAEESDHAAIPLIPYDAIAGYGSFDFQELPIEDFYTVEELRGADFLIRVKGDSMSPKYNGGDIVACKRIDAITFWQWHKVYAICTRNQGILIKRVEEYQHNPAFITCRSENPQYRPFELHEDEIVSVALVLGAIVLE